ncbi:hypothetical protein RN001_015938 [Aquatica leii]|uniref:Uncharacterized protein n=1 Tax=Aquatica leii TaxID=1421715 RepID=A0AAN7SB48_9COLE|nr:hypothetical protein RN001_015938 [Aquatica leii]
MSCTVQIKTRNSVKSKKVNNVVHRTTSETIRLGEPDLLSNSSRQLNTVISPPPLKQSSCSFQVTSVSVAQRTDYGDDSADDLDESHTDDISRVTDNETPSYSEDTCSRDAEDNYNGYCSALCSVTVIPSSSQYGLAIMPLSTTSSNDNSITNKASDETNTTESQGLSNSDIEVATSRFPGTRFKVVKVETSTPFRRGRWWCMDYLDQSPYAPKNAFTYKSSEGLEICSQLQYTMTATTMQAQPVEENVESGTNYSILNSIAPTQSTDTILTFPSCSISEKKTQRFIIHRDNELLKVQSHLHVPATNHQTKNKKNGTVPKQQNYCASCEQELANETINCQCSPSKQLEHSEICDLTKTELLESSINENLELDIDSLADLSLTNIIQNSLQQKLKESGTVSSYLAWELFSQTPLCAVTQNSHIFDKCLNENSSVSNRNKNDSSTGTTPFTTQANTSPTHDSLKVIDSNSAESDSANADASVMSTFPLISGRFSIFDDISILATRAIIDNFSNSFIMNISTV